MQGAQIPGQGMKIPCVEQFSQKKKRMYKWIKELYKSLFTTTFLQIIKNIELTP